MNTTCDKCGAPASIVFLEPYCSNDCHLDLDNYSMEQGKSWYTVYFYQTWDYAILRDAEWINENGRTAREISTFDNPRHGYSRAYEVEYVEPRSAYPGQVIIPAGTRIRMVEPA